MRSAAWVRGHPGWGRKALVGVALMGVMAQRVPVVPLAAAADFASGQNRAPRVKAARAARGAAVRELFESKGLAYPPAHVFVRAFKKDMVLELWAGPVDGPLVQVKAFPICAASGDLGPKRREGDGQVPEGFYEVDRFNPYSNFHLSLGLNYPNAADRLRIGKGVRTGGDIFIHGSCVTIGCMPLEDGPVEELYLALLDARLAGQKRVAVHVFPTRMTDENLAWLRTRAGEDAALVAFWESLVPVYRAFETNHRVPRVRVEKDGRYALVNPR